jgi:hypothetical protein
MLVTQGLNTWDVHEQNINTYRVKSLYTFQVGLNQRLQIMGLNLKRHLWFEKNLV